ncbi:MAG: glycosyltransferase [Deltaproteobacteria bacterium]
MGIPFITNEKTHIKLCNSFYISTTCKFFIANVLALAWFVLSTYICLHWISFLSGKAGTFIAWYIVLFIALIPGYLNVFLLISLLLDRPPNLYYEREYPPVTLLIAVYNGEECIGETLKAISKQDYAGEVRILIINDGSTDNTINIIKQINMKDCRVLTVRHRGKAKALNKGLKHIKTEYTICIDADTFLQPQALKRIMARMLGDPVNTSAVAGCVLTKNSRQSFMAKLQEWDYFLAISSVKRQQALFQATLVAQGAFSAFKTSVLKEINGWPDCIGEDIVLTWAMIKAGYRIGFESSAVGFTLVPEKYSEFARQRRRWARGMIEAFKNHFDVFFKKVNIRTFIIGLDLLLPFMDITYTFIFIPGIILALFGYFWIVGPMTLTVLPFTLLISTVMYKLQSKNFVELKLKVRKNKIGFVVYTLAYQLLMAPICVWGYAEELMGVMKRW